MVALLTKQAGLLGCHNKVPLRSYKGSCKGAIEVPLGALAGCGGYGRVVLNTGLGRWIRVLGLRAAELLPKKQSVIGISLGFRGLGCRGFLKAIRLLQTWL